MTTPENQDDIIFDQESENLSEYVKAQVDDSRGRAQKKVKMNKMFFIFIFIFMLIVAAVFSMKSKDASRGKPVEIATVSAKPVEDTQVSERKLEDIKSYNNDVVDARNDSGGLERSIQVLNHETTSSKFTDKLFSDDSDGSGNGGGAANNQAGNDNFLKCSEDDTRCMQVQGIIGKNDCAPKDFKCLSRKSLSANGGSDQGAQSANTSDRISPNASEVADYLNSLSPDELARLLKDAQSVLDDEHYKAILNSKELMQKLSELIKPEFGGSQQPTIVTLDFDKPETSPIVQPEQSIASNIKESAPSQNSDEPKEIKLIKDGAVYFGVNKRAINSRIPTAVHIDILHEKPELRGAYVLGTSSVVDEYLQVDLTRLVLEDGRVCPIKANAMALDTTYLALRSDIDRHLLYRYGFWSAGVLTSAVGAGLAASTDTTVIFTEAGAYESVKGTTKKAVGSGLAELGNQTGSELKKRIDTPPTITVSANEDVGVYFDSGVLLSNCK